MSSAGSARPAAGPAAGRLHLLLSPERSALEDCLQLAGARDAVLLLGRGVRLVLREAELRRLCVAAGAVAAAAADLEARGLPCPDGIAALGENEWAALVRDHAQTLSWT